MRSSFGRVASQVSAAAFAAVMVFIFNLDAFVRVSGIEEDDIQSLLLGVLLLGLIAGIAGARELPEGKRIGSLGGIFSLINGGLFLAYAMYALLLLSGQK